MSWGFDSTTSVNVFGSLNGVMLAVLIIVPLNKKMDNQEGNRLFEKKRRNCKNSIKRTEKILKHSNQNLKIYILTSVFNLLLF